MFIDVTRKGTAPSAGVAEPEADGDIFAPVWKESPGREAWRNAELRYGGMSQGHVWTISMETCLDL